MNCKFNFIAAGILISGCWPSLHAATDPAPASGNTRTHLEACTKWKEIDNSFGFTNACGKPVSLLFMQLNGQHEVHRIVQPGERFESGVPERTLSSGGWIFTACPAGYVPTEPFTVENRDPILKGHYECARKPD